MAFADRIAECNAHDLSRYVPWSVGGRRVGFVRGDRAAFLLEPGMPFDRTGDVLRLAGHGHDELSARLAHAMQRLAARGDAPRPRGEPYPVAAPVRGAPACVVDRGYVAWLGVQAAGVHVNGFVRAPREADRSTPRGRRGSADAATRQGRGLGREGIAMWIAQRSRSKPTFPGMLDNMVAGGQPHGIGLRANVVKECGEEAGIPATLASCAVAVGAVSYVFEDETGLKPDTMFCFDLELPSDFEPRCVDGEVERFVLMPIDEVAALVRDTRRFKFNCNLVIIDFLVRHGLLEADEPGYAALVASLRRPLPE